MKALVDHQPQSIDSHIRSEKHIPALDGLRGIAILMVLIFHFTTYGHGLPAPAVLADKIFLTVSGTGWIGVDLFFVLSGFLITGILYDSRESVHYLRNFYVRRILRIFPLYYVTLLVFLLVLPGLFQTHTGLQSMQQDGFWYSTYLTNIQIALTSWPGFGALGHLWSLAVEEQFYLIWPFVILVFSRRALMWVCGLSVCGALFLRAWLWMAQYPTAAFVLTPARMDAFAIGALLALVVRGSGNLSRLIPLARGTAAVTGAVLTGTVIWKNGLSSDDPFVGIIGFSVLAVFFGSVLVLGYASTPYSVLGRFLSSQCLRFFGRYSYGLYVLHHPILFFVPPALAMEQIPRLSGSQLPAYLLYIGLAGLVSVGLALLSWTLCEKRFLKLKVRFPASQPSNGGRREVRQV